MVSFVAASGLSVSAIADAPERASWVRPDNGVRFAGRDVIADAGFGLPELGATFYLFTRKPLRREQIGSMSSVGLRYLGVIASQVYAFQRVDKLDVEQRAFLRAQPNFIGTNGARAVDRVDENVLPYLENGKALPHALTVHFLPEVSAAELMAWVPGEHERLRLPTDPTEAIREEALVRLSRAASTPDNLARLARSPLVGAIGFQFKKKALNADSRSLSNSDPLWSAPYELDGTGVVVGHWDGGRVAQHGDYTGRVTNYENRGTSSHATHTAGTILGDGSGSSQGKGFAPAATMVAYDFYGDPGGERRAAKHEHYHEHDNHSWGQVVNNYGGYDGGAQEFDLDSRDLFLMAMKAAGNDGSQSERVVQGYGFDSLPPDSTGKNVLVIGATDDDGDLTGFSSRGPTNDGRIKPDLSGNGQNLTSTWPGGGYSGSSGTSMSTPSVTGIVTLLAQLWKDQHDGERWAPDMTRVVLIHTVTDVFHRGPDYRHGWGNVDAKAAADLIIADGDSPGTRLVRGSVRQGETVEYKMDVAAGTPELKVTFNWLDATANSTAQRRLIHDLDLELTSPSGTTHYPWTLDPSSVFDDAVRSERNTIDNVEQVLVDNPEGGEWTVKVFAREITDPRLNVQGYAMASSQTLKRTLERIRLPISAGGEAIPDNDPSGLELEFPVTDPRDVLQARIRLDVRHPARGNLLIQLEHPDGTSVTIEQNDTSTRRDIYAIWPDLRSYDDDVTSLINRPGNGTWTVRVMDMTGGQTGGVFSAMLEVEFDGIAPPPPNTPPVANAGADIMVNAGEPVTLDGRMSFDADGDPLTYAWTQQAGAAVILTAEDADQATFTAPTEDDTQTLVFQLAVADGRMGVSTDDVTVTIIGTNPGKPNGSPMAVTNGNQEVPPNVDVWLDASASSDPDNDPMTFSWTQISGPTVVFATPMTAIAQFMSPETTEAIDLAFRVEVEDSRGALDLEDVVITVDPDTTNMPPDPPTNMPPTGNPPPGAQPSLNATLNGGCTCEHTSSARGPWSLGALGLLALAALRRRRR